MLIAIGLALDAFAAAVGCGLKARPLSFRYALRIAFFFGLFQALMPMLGWGAGRSLERLIAACDHWIAFLLLVGVGGKMIYESLRDHGRSAGGNQVSLKRLLLLALATSLDALAVGISLAFLKEDIVCPSLIIGAVTFALSFGGVWLGSRFGHIFENKLEMLGGLILIGIAVKILLSHIMA